jgi:cholesterol transport system auxiliary component
VRWRGATLLALCVGVVGCSGLFRSNAKPEQIYYLRAPSAPPASPASGTSGSAAGVAAAAGTAAPASPVSLRVVGPIADPGLDSARIMLVQADHRMNFYSGARWPAPVPELIESLAVQTLRASGDWASVQDSASPFPADYLLQMHVRRFEADYTAGGTAPLAQVVFDCTVGRRHGREVLASFTVAGSAAASANHLSQVVAAFEQATGAALDALVQQSVQAARVDAQGAAQNEGQPSPSPER